VQSIVYMLQSSAFEPIPSLSRTCARLIRSCVRSHLFDKQQCSDTLDRTSIAIKRTCNTATYLRVCDRSYCPGLERTSDDCTNILEAVCSIFSSFSFD
jgi:hypothetical protein